MPARARVRERPNVLLQGLELLVTVLLARNRQPPPTVAAGLLHADFAAELVSLPSGLLAMVCEAIVKLKVILGAACVRGCVRAFRLHGGWEGAEHGACQSMVGAGLAFQLRAGPAVSCV